LLTTSLRNNKAKKKKSRSYVVFPLSWMLLAKTAGGFCMCEMHFRIMESHFLMLETHFRTLGSHILMHETHFRTFEDRFLTLGTKGTLVVGRVLFRCYL
jgi:hypothetical protein